MKNNNALAAGILAGGALWLAFEIAKIVWKVLVLAFQAAIVAGLIYGTWHYFSR